MKAFDIKARFVPVEFMKLTNISHLDKFVLSCIWGLDDNGCTAGDDYIALQVVCTERQVRRSIMKLHKLGYIKIDCVRGKGILGTDRKIYCKMLVETTDRNQSVVSETTIPKSVSGIDRNRSVVGQPVQGEHISQTTDFSEHTEDIHNNILLYSENKTVIPEQITRAEFQTLIPKPGACSSLMEKLKQEAKKQGRCVGFRDDQLVLLADFDEESLVISMRLASERCRGTQVSWNYFAKIVEGTGVKKVAPRPVNTFKPTRKLCVLP